MKHVLEELAIVTADRAGLLAEVAERLGEAGLNIETICASTHAGTAVIRLVVDDGAGAAMLLKEQGYEVEARQALVATLDDRPGELAAYCRRLAASGVNLAAAYVNRRVAGETELIVVVENGAPPVDA